jgi:hypothetical protein
MTPMMARMLGDGLLIHSECSNRRGYTRPIHTVGLSDGISNLKGNEGLILK